MFVKKHVMKRSLAFSTSHNSFEVCLLFISVGFRRLHVFRRSFGHASLTFVLGASFLKDNRIAEELVGQVSIRLRGFSIRER